MKGKRWLCVLLGALLALSLGLFAACGNTEEEQQTVAVASVWFAQQAQTNTFEGRTVTLAANIDLNGQEWTPIAEGSRSGNTYSEGDAHFDGTFDGNGLTIAGLTISALPQGASPDYAVGLFGVVDGGTVRNFTLADIAIDVEASECAGGAVGLLVGGGTAENIIVSGSITAGRGNGGVVGRMTVSGAIRGCTNNAAVTGVDAGGNTGGIVGHLYNYGLVRENVNTAEEISAQLFASGIVGSLQFEAKNVVSALEKDTDVDIVYNASATAATGIAADFTHVYVYNNMTDGTTYDRVLEPNFATEEALDEALAALAE